MNISETRRPITIKFYQKHHLVGRKAAFGFAADQIRTLVSVATDSPHSVIMGKRRYRVFLTFLIASFSYLQVTHKSLNKFDPIRPLTAELAALGRLENTPIE